MSRNARRILAALIVALAPVWLAAAALGIKARTFPFVEFEPQSPAEFGVIDAEFAALDLPEDFHIPEKYSTRGDDWSKVEAAGRWTRDVFQHGHGVVIGSPVEALGNSKEAKALCSEYAKFFVAACQSAGIPARVVWMNAHTTAEVSIDGRAIIADPNGNVIWRGGDGALLGIADARREAKARAETFLEEKSPSNDPDFLETPSLNVYRDFTFAIVVEGDRLFDFHERNRAPGVLLGVLTGMEMVAEAKVLIAGDGAKLGAGAALLRLGVLGFLLQVLLGGVLFFTHGKPREQSGEENHP